MSIQDDLAAETIERKNNPLAIIVLVGIILIAATYLISKNIREGSEERLATAEGIAAAWNKQALAVKAFEDERKAAADEREFNRFLYGSTEPPPEVVQQQIERNTRRLAEQNEKRKTPQD